MKTFLTDITTKIITLVILSTILIVSANADEAMTIDPFMNEEESLQIDDLTIENRTDRIEIYGSFEITRDKAGLDNLVLMQNLLDKIYKKMHSEELPEHITIIPPNTVKNPF